MLLVCTYSTSCLLKQYLKFCIVFSLSDVKKCFFHLKFLRHESEILVTAFLKASGLFIPHITEF